MTTRSDVYSLGALLFEMVTAMPAFDTENLTNTKRLPPTPSIVTRERARKNQLTGDLDAIILKALQPNPQDRYSSAELLAAEIRRTLAQQPVQAVPQTWTYRANKFIRRNPWLASGALISLLAVTAGWTGTEISRHRAEAEANRGWGAHAQVKLANDFLQDLSRELIQSKTTWQITLQEYAQQIPERFQKCPESEGLAALAVGELYAEHELWDHALPLINRALALVNSGDLGNRERKRIESLLERAG